MAVSIVVGGQYGSEGKGKVAYLWAEKTGASAVVRVGGSNSGHTVYDKDNRMYTMRMLPTASIQENMTAVLPAGSYIDVPVLMEEIKAIGISRDHLKIDPNAMIILEKHKEEERKKGMQEKIGSTLSGTGAAVADRARRSEDVILAGKVPELAPFIHDTKKYLRGLLDQGKHIVIEGTQGYGLSNYHTQEYPYATSRDTTAAGFLAETGLSPFDVDHIVMTIRTFPIRVAGHSGRIAQEINWKQVSEESGSQEYFEEKTTVTHRVRRVARFTSDVVKEAIRANQPDVIVLNHMDYIDISHQNVKQLSPKQVEFLAGVEREIGRKISYCGTGTMNLIEMGVDG